MQELFHSLENSPQKSSFFKFLHKEFFSHSVAGGEETSTCDEGQDRPAEEEVRGEESNPDPEEGGPATEERERATGDETSQRETGQDQQTEGS